MKPSNQINNIPKNKIIAYPIPGIKKDVTQFIRACKPTREWMDETPGRYAYRCIPLTAANTMGWEILNPVDVDVIWHLNESRNEIEINAKEQDPFSPQQHFGSGIITWYLPFIFRTSDDYGIVISGSPNKLKEDIAPLDAFVRTDWLPFPFTMNWKITTPNKRISFHAGEPICRIFPYPLALLGEIEMEIQDINDDPVFLKKMESWNQKRQENYQQKEQLEQQWLAEGKQPEIKDMWNTQYAKGIGSENNKHPHQNTFKCKEVKDKRNKDK